ncbi:MAG: gamma-glutamylcyclotransferase [Pseudomonadota bacterium]
MWVFAYGSLLWDPGFTPVEQLRADMPGHIRSFCMWSIHHRGTPETPGLVLALDRGAGQCAGMALRVSDTDQHDVLAMLRERELVSSAYEEVWVPLALADGRGVQAVTYMINRDHPQYCPELTLEDQAQVIASAVGGRGPNPDYLYNTTRLLRDLGIPDPDLDWLETRVKQITGD